MTESKLTVSESVVDRNTEQMEKKSTFRHFGPVAAPSIDNIQKLRDCHLPSKESKGGEEGGRRKIRRRRGNGRRRNWKPYHKLSTEEKRVLEAREEKRAETSRAKRFADGQPMAPYNTTQFILNDQEQRTAGGKNGVESSTTESGSIQMSVGSGGHDEQQRERVPSGSDAGNTSETGSGFNSEWEREFDAEYDNASMERLGNLSREELTRDYLLLEHQLDEVMSDNRKLRRENIVIRSTKKDGNSIPD